MALSDVLHGYDKYIKFNAKIRLAFFIFVGASISIVLGLYFGGVFFGERSLEVMLGLQNKKELLTSEIEKLKQENAELQKQYFELKMLYESVK